MQALELQSPGAKALELLNTEDPKMSITTRFGLVRADRATGESVAGKATGTTHHAYNQAVSKLKTTGVAGKAALLQTYKAWQQITLFSDPASGRTTYTMSMLKDVADAQGNLMSKADTLPLLLGKIFTLMRLEKRHFSKAPSTWEALRTQVVALTEEFFFQHVFHTPARELILRGLLHMPRIKHLAFSNSDEAIPQGFLLAALKQHSIVGPGASDTTDATYFTQVLQLERLIDRLIPEPSQLDEPNNSWGEQLLDKLGKTTSQTKFKTLFAAYITSITKEDSDGDGDEDEDVDEEEIVVDTNALSPLQLWGKASPPKKRKVVPETKDPEPETRGGDRTNRDDPLTINDVSINEMKINPKSLHKNWISTTERPVYLLGQFRDEVSNTIGTITGAEYNANTGFALWTATFLDGRSKSLTVEQVGGGVTFYNLWREAEIAKGNPDPSKLARVGDQFAGGNSRSGSGAGTGKSKRKPHFTLPNVKQELRKLSRTQKIDLRQYCENADGSAAGAVYEDSDSEGDQPSDGSGDFDGLDLTQVVEGQHFILLRTALQKLKSKDDNMSVHDMQVMIDKHRKINDLLKQQLRLHLDADTMYLMVFGVNGRLSTFSALIEMARDPAEEFGEDSKLDKLYMTGDGYVQRQKVTTDVRSKTALKTCEDWEKAALYFQYVLNAWHPGVVPYTAIIPSAMLRQKLNSGEHPGACLKLLEHMWTTWCQSLSKAISVATKASKHSAHGFYLCDIACFHNRYHVRVLEDDYWETIGEAECRRFKAKVQDQKAEAVQSSNTLLSQQVQALSAQCTALAKSGTGAGRKKPTNNPAPAPAPAGQGRRAQAKAKRAAAAAQPQAPPARQQAGRNRVAFGAAPPALDPVLGASMRYLKSPDAVRQAVAASTFATLQEAQTDFSRNDTTPRVNNRGGCFWTKSAIGKTETGGCPYPNCLFVH